MKSCDGSCHIIFINLLNFFSYFHQNILRPKIGNYNDEMHCCHGEMNNISITVELPFGDQLFCQAVFLFDRLYL